MDDQIQHPRLGTLSYDAEFGAWVGTFPCPPLARLGGQYGHANPHLNPRWKDAKVRIVPPPGARLFPLPEPASGGTGTPIQVEIACAPDDDEEGPSGPPEPEQLDAVVALLDDPGPTIDVALAAIVGDLRRREADLTVLPAEDRPRFEAILLDPAEVGAFLYFKAVRVSTMKGGKGGRVVVGFRGECVWDEEHGLGVTVSDGKMVDVGGAYEARSLD